jgi:hypothetical protein
MTNTTRTYLALGDSMSIDEYTGVEGGGAVSQFHRWLGAGWTLDDRSFDGCMMREVPTDGHGDVITLTIGGNDLLWNRERYLAQGLSSFAEEHLRLLKALRSANRDAVLIVGDVYRPDATLGDVEIEALGAANRAIRSNCLAVGARLATIHDAFLGRQSELLCRQIEPTLKGAEVIAGLFREQYAQRQV